MSDLACWTQLAIEFTEIRRHLSRALRSDCCYVQVDLSVLMSHLLGAFASSHLYQCSNALFMRAETCVTLTYR
jgi:hypothetical protein